MVKKYFIFIFLLENDCSFNYIRFLFLGWDRVELYEAALKLQFVPSTHWVPLNSIWRKISCNVFLENLNFFPSEKEIHEHIGWHGVSKLSGSELILYKYIHFIIFFRKWLIISLHKTHTTRLGLSRALWSCIETAIWTFNQLGPIEIHNMKKNPGTFFSKNLISFRLKKDRHKHVGWHGSKLSGHFYSGSELQPLTWHVILFKLYYFSFILLWHDIMYNMAWHVFRMHI